MIRIDKALVQLQIATRSECKKMAKQGRICLNGQPIRDTGVKLDWEKDLLTVDNQVVEFFPYEYFMLHKPAGCVTATTDAREKTVMDYLPERRHRDLSPVGRLDKDTEGLLLITDDGELNHALLAPGRHVEKTYFARVSGVVTEDIVARFRQGLDIGEKKPTAEAKLVICSAGEVSEVEITITEGKFHQIKRMFAAVGLTVLYLKRLRMGSLVLDDALAPGECRRLTAEEIARLK